MFIVGVVNGWRAYALGQQTQLLLTFAPTLDPRFRLVVALIIAVISVWLAAALWRKHSFTRWAIPLFIFICALYRIVLLATWVQSPVARQGWFSEMVLYAAAVLLTTWALSRRASQTYFSNP